MATALWSWALAVALGLLGLPVVRQLKALAVVLGLPVVQQLTPREPLRKQPMMRHPQPQAPPTLTEGAQVDAPC